MRKGLAELLVVLPLALLLFAHGLWEIVSRHGWSAPRYGPPVAYLGARAVVAGLGEALLGCVLVAAWIASRPGYRRLGVVLALVSLAGSLMAGLGLATGVL